ncbi:hypothetical protein [Mesorhizobium argentiipisi]|uniref:Uncharacterized protein n=1 Tax=Mesorhizobium argentiipisi TaxID=3015175 RepID=A0ABU8KNH9_9HYPH
MAGHVDDIDNRITHALENTSISAALAAPNLVQGKHFGLRLHGAMPATPMPSASPAPQC